MIGAAIAQTWWGVIRGPDLLARTDNPRRSIADRYVPRGRSSIAEASEISVTIGNSGSLPSLLCVSAVGASQWLYASFLRASRT